MLIFGRVLCGHKGLKLSLYIDTGRWMVIMHCLARRICEAVSSSRVGAMLVQAYP